MPSKEEAETKGDAPAATGTTEEAPTASSVTAAVKAIEEDEGLVVVNAVEEDVDSAGERVNDEHSSVDGIAVALART